MTTLLQRTVLFADLRGSTGLFETLGNAEAAAVVTQSVALMGQVRSWSAAVAPWSRRSATA
jgi:adenylate cyclase